MTDRSVETQEAMTLAQAKQMYQRTLSLWVIDYLASRSIINRQRAVRSILSAEHPAVSQE